MVEDRPIQDSLHINVKHIYGVSKLSYAVDVHLDDSSSYYRCSCWTSLLTLYLKFWSPSGEAISIVLWLRLSRPSKMAPTSMSNTYYMVFHNLHMLWMHVSIRSLHYFCSLVGQAFGYHLKFRWPPDRQPTAKCSDWGRTHSRWLTPQCHTHVRRLTTFKCCRCAYGWVLNKLPLLLLAKLVDVT